MDSTRITLDLETSGLDWKKDKILLCGYRINGQGEVIYADPNRRDDYLYSCLVNPDTVLVGSNIKFDALFLSNNGYKINCKLEDIRVMAYVCRPELQSHGLKNLCLVLLGRKPTELGDILFKPLKREQHVYDFLDYYFDIGGELVRRDYLTSYHMEDVLNVDRIRALLSPPKWYFDIELPLTRILFDMELSGCPLDKEQLSVLHSDFTTVANALLLSLQQGSEFNPNSPIQVQEKFKEMGYDLSKLCEKTPTGGYKVDKLFLKKLSWKGETFAQVLLDYRKYSKLLSTYVGPLHNYAQEYGHVYGSINQAGSTDLYGDGSRGTNTGRLASVDPNLQNIPARTKEGKSIRKAFIVSPGKFGFNTDFAQIEPRYIAHLSQAPKLLRAYREGLDTHGMFGADIFNKKIEDLSKTERFIGKTSWLATVYGCSYKKLLMICETNSDDPLTLDLKPYLGMFKLLPLKKSKYVWGDSQDVLRKKYGDEAEEVYAKWMFFKNVQDTFRKKNPEIMAWAESEINRCRRVGHILTFGGRIIPVPEIHSSDRALRAYAERRAVNAPVQGSCADIMKIVLVRFDREFVQQGMGRLYTTVHDELNGEMNKQENIEIVNDIMENTVQLNNVKIKADTKLVTNWGEK